jgi:acylphosphatase
MADEGEVKALFYIEPKTEKNRVQHIGCRMVILQEMIKRNFKQGNVFNLDDGRVEVLIQGNGIDIGLFHSYIKDNLYDLLISGKQTEEGKKLVRDAVGNPGFNVTGLELKPHLIVHDLALASHSLELNQFEKGIDVYAQLISVQGRLISVSDELVSVMKRIEEKI